MSTDNVIKILCGFLLTGLFSWVGVVASQIEAIRAEHALEQKQTVEAISKISKVLALANQVNRLTLEVLQTDLLTLIDDTGDLERLEDSIKRFWKIHRWTLKAINEIRVKAGDPLIDWPDLE